jgi:hypothetical protein
MNTIYMGHDPREQIAYDVAEKSIRYRTRDVLINPLKLGQLSMLTRPVERKDGKLWCPISRAPMATEFAISRFCVPFLQSSGWALFVDCDILCLSDIAELFALADDRYAVQVVKHKHESGAAVKMDDQAQTYYARKNWSSVILWNCGHPGHQALTQHVLNNWPGRDLHAFQWLKDQDIGTLPQHWNWLVNVTPGEPEAKGILHYTLGGPWFKNLQPTKLDSFWLKESER